LWQVSFFRRVDGFKMEQGTAIKFRIKLNKTATEAFEMLKVRTVNNVYREQVCVEWYKRFKEGRESLQDDEPKGSPSTSRREESTEVIQESLAEDRTLSVRMLDEGD
jgi:hypothetical protein